MANLIALKSKATGLVGNYPASHLGLDDDLVLYTPEDEPNEPEVEVLEPAPEVQAEDAKTTGKDRVKYGR